MLNYRLAVVLACLLTGASASAFAAHGGGGGSPGGMSSGHMSSSGLRNTNGPEATDRDKGVARAEDRMSSAGADHNKAQPTQTKGKHRRSQPRRTEQHH